MIIISAKLPSLLDCGDYQYAVATRDTTTPPRDPLGVGGSPPKITEFTNKEY